MDSPQPTSNAATAEAVANCLIFIVGWLIEGKTGKEGTWQPPAEGVAGGVR
jgi:hypothetical protein